MKTSPAECPDREDEVLATLRRAVEKSVGKKIEDVRNQTITARRKEVEAHGGRPLAFVSHFPFIGRGNVLRDRTISHERVNSLLDNALRD
jgi:hypothetical protein